MPCFPSQSGYLLLLFAILGLGALPLFSAGSLPFSNSACVQSDTTRLTPYTQAETCTWVILGSSTAEGTGATIKDSSWVGRLKTYLEKDIQFSIVNLAKGGITSFHIMPTSLAHASHPFQADPSLNMDRALEARPVGIIVNMPSNDAANYIDAKTQMQNFRALYQLADTRGLEFWITTSQPRNFGDQQQIVIQEEVRDSILQFFGPRALDLWTPLADSISRLKPAFGSGDGIHLNDQGHRLIFDAVVRSVFLGKQCRNTPYQQDSFSYTTTQDQGQIQILAKEHSQQWLLTYSGNKTGILTAVVYNGSGKLIKIVRLDASKSSWPLQVTPEEEKTIEVVVSWSDGSWLKSRAALK